ncbi:hypothetical protein BY996DRAFT_6426487 [Phakopsora pachyrhizi]|nr:hypothetical protein BY996DRAFT_6426485 [Phakopsora pachyrhizi]KAI8444033.1 hypothetical protein BY996DRAFT_6426487 [Phakopsora pachyrhizi]
MTLLSSNTPHSVNCVVHQQILGSENSIHNNDSTEEGSILLVPLEILHSISGPAPSKEVYFNLHVLVAPTGVAPIVLRSELQKADMKVYLESCTKIEKALNDTVLYCASFPVVPKEIVYSLKKVAIKCNKRKHDVFGGGPIPEEDLIDLTSDQEKENDSGPEVEAQQFPAARKIKMSQATGGSKQTHKNVQKQYKSKAIAESGDEAKTNSEREEGEILEAVNAVVLDTEADLTNSTHITDIQVSGGVNGENIILVPAAVTTQDISAKAISASHVVPADQTVPTASTSPLITFVNPNTTFTTQNALNATPEIIHNGPQSSVDSTPKIITVLLNDERKYKLVQHLHSN